MTINAYIYAEQQGKLQTCVKGVFSATLLMMRELIEEVITIDPPLFWLCVHNLD